MRIRRDRFSFNRSSSPTEISVSCCAFDKLLDARVGVSIYGGFQIDVSYLTCDDLIRDKRFIIYVMSENNNVPDDIIFLKSDYVIVADSAEHFFIFYTEIKPTRELRDYKIDQINI